MKPFTRQDIVVGAKFICNDGSRDASDYDITIIKVCRAEVDLLWGDGNVSKGWSIEETLLNRWLNEPVYKYGRDKTTNVKSLYQKLTSS